MIITPQKRKLHTTVWPSQSLTARDAKSDTTGMVCRLTGLVKVTDKSRSDAFGKCLSPGLALDDRQECLSYPELLTHRPFQYAYNAPDKTNDVIDK